MMLSHAHGRLQHPDRQPARPRRRCSRSWQAQRFHSFPAVNTLFNAMANHPDFDTRRLEPPGDLGRRRHGGAAARPPSCGSRRPAARSSRATACPRPRPSATCNPVDSTAYSGNIGLPMPNTELTLLDDDGHEVPLGLPGEIAIRGPQVMAGYWQRPDETAKVMTRRRLLPHRRHRHGRRARLLQDRRPQEGHDPGQRLQRLPERGRGRGHADARRARVRRGRRARREGRRGGQAGDRARRTRPSPRPRSAPTARPTSPATSGRRSSSSATSCRRRPVGKILRRELRDKA